MKNIKKNMNNKVCILTSVHEPFDTRIFHKQAKSLLKAGYDVTLIAQHNKAEIVDGVKIVALPKSKNRLRRILGTWRVFQLALKQRAEFYHFHDPELIPIAVLLKLFSNGKVIHDVHENVKHDILTKSWLPRTVRGFLSLMYQLMEKAGLPFFDENIIAEDSYIENYRKQNNILALRNYPMLSFSKSSSEVKYSRPTLIYVGRITQPRGMWELVESIRLLKPKYDNILLSLVGLINPVSLEEQLGKLLQQFSLQQNVQLVGKVKHDEIYAILPRCHIGMAILHPIPNYLESLPTKLFEYMAAGLPVVASNFPLWKDIVEGNNCGVTVDPLNSNEIAKAVEYLIEHSYEARKMGQNGRNAVIEKYNWETESRKLLDLYKDLYKYRD
ncbi:glycosyltransferase family 4 protein [Chloroflexota bacterium]